MSGNCSRSSSQTDPIVRGRGSAPPAPGVSRRCSSLEERQPVLADLHLVVVLEDDRLDARAG